MQKMIFFLIKLYTYEKVNVHTIRTISTLINTQALSCIKGIVASLQSNTEFINVKLCHRQQNKYLSISKQ